jgi:hypothetical protein
MKTATLTLLFVLADPCSAAVKDCAMKFPKIKKTLETVAPLRVPGSRTFKELVQIIKVAEKTANAEQEAIQVIGCGINSTDTLDACLKPLIWSCESVPISLDTEFLTHVKKTKTEEQALLADQLLESRDLSNGCCGDFGCHETGAGVPEVFYNKEKSEALAQLAQDTGQFGNIALGSLRATAAGLKKATCSCGAPSHKDFLEIVKMQKAVQASIKIITPRAKQVITYYGEIIFHLEKALKKKECNLPGY